MVVTRFARLRRARDHHGAAPRSRSPRGLMVVTRFARLRRARDHHEFPRQRHVLAQWAAVRRAATVFLGLGGHYTRGKTGPGHSAWLAELQRDTQENA